MTSFAFRRRALKLKRTQTSIHNRQKLTQQQTRLLTQKKTIAYRVIRPGE